MFQSLLWAADCHYLVLDECGKWATEYREVSVSVVIQPKDGRLRDLDNYFKALFDFLESSRIIDNDRQIRSLMAERLDPDYNHHSLTVEIVPHDARPQTE